MCKAHSKVTQLQEQLSACVDDVALWMQSNRLQLNASKTEVLWSASSRRQDQLPCVAVRIGSDSVTPVTSVRDLGIYLDSDGSTKTHVSKTVSNCFAVLRQLRIAYVGRSHSRSCSRPSCHWCFLVWTTATRR